MADRVLGDLDHDRLAGLERLLDAVGAPLDAAGVVVDLAGVEHRVAALADVDERRLHRRQDVLDLAEVDVAGVRGGAGLGHVVLDQDVVLEHRDLRAVAGLAHDHHPVDGLAAGQELGLGEDRRAALALLATVAAALALGLEPGRAGQAAHTLVVSGGAATGLARAADPYDGVGRVVRAGARRPHRRHGCGDGGDGGCHRGRRSPSPRRRRRRLPLASRPPRRPRSRRPRRPRDGHDHGHDDRDDGGDRRRSVGASSSVSSSSTSSLVSDASSSSTTASVASASSSSASSSSVGVVLDQQRQLGRRLGAGRPPATACGSGDRLGRLEHHDRRKGRLLRRDDDRLRRVGLVDRRREGDRGRCGDDDSARARSVVLGGGRLGDGLGCGLGRRRGVSGYGSAGRRVVGRLSNDGLGSRRATASGTGRRRRPAAAGGLGECASAGAESAGGVERLTGSPAGRVAARRRRRSRRCRVGRCAQPSGSLSGRCCLSRRRGPAAGVGARRRAGGVGSGGVVGRC